MAQSRSISGTITDGGTGEALIGATIYDGSVHNAVIIMCLIGGLTMMVFGMRRMIAPEPFVHSAPDLVRD